MKLRDYIKTLQDIAKENKEALDYPLIFAGDIEGNYFEEVHYHPAPVHFDGENIDLTGERHVNAICIN